MKLEFEKKVHMVSELISYCHLKGAAQYHLDMDNCDKTTTTIIISASPVKLSADELDLLQTYLCAPRRSDMEQEYWNLTGESEDSTELRLVGMMCDKATIEYSGQDLKLILERDL